MPNKKPVAIIAARGGSKRLPNKNVLPVLGKPMIAYPILACLESNVFSRVIVSTEDDAIASVSADFGAEILKRDPVFSKDNVGVTRVCLHVLEELGLRDSEIAFCNIYSSAIFLGAELIRLSCETFQKNACDILMGVSDFNIQPQQALYEKGGYLMPFWPEHIVGQSQDYPRFVGGNGSLYWATANRFCREQSFYSGRVLGFAIPKNRHVDVDTEEDYNLLCALAAYHHEALHA